jgi:hemolysin D
MMHNLLQRYLTVFRHVWTHRKEFEHRPLNRLEAEFQPAALALRDDPAPAAPRVLMALLALFALIAVLWATFGEIDIVATAVGRIVPDDYTKVVQPLDSGVVKAIHIKEGQEVRVGDPLVDLDTTISHADVDKMRDALQAARLQAMRGQSLWKAVTAGTAPGPIAAQVGIPAARIQDENALLTGQYEEFHSKLAGIDAEIALHQAEITTTEAEIRKLEETLPLAEERAADYRSLENDKYVSHHAYLEKEQSSIEQRQDLATQRSRLQETRAAIQESQRKRESLITETARTALDSRHEAEQKMLEAAPELVKSEEKNRLTRLTAPIDGVVQQLAIHTVGGVVTQAQTLMNIVPKDHPLMIEASLDNKDIGFVSDGQPAEVKIETFEYTKYGTIPATVQHVSRDAVQDKKLGLRFTTLVQLARSSMMIDGKDVKLGPGMAVTVEIKTGKRRVIEYFLSPLLQYRQESLRER